MAPTGPPLGPPPPGGELHANWLAAINVSRDADDPTCARAIVDWLHSYHPAGRRPDDVLIIERLVSLNFRNVLALADASTEEVREKFSLGSGAHPELAGPGAARMRATVVRDTVGSFLWESLPVPPVPSPARPPPADLEPLLASFTYALSKLAPIYTSAPSTQLRDCIYMITSVL